MSVSARLIVQEHQAETRRAQDSGSCHELPFLLTRRLFAFALLVFFLKLLPLRGACGFLTALRVTAAFAAFSWRASSPL
jgi:hypothetical protein